MKRQFAAILLLISILSLAVCHKEPSTPNACVPSIMYNGEIYCTTGKQMPGEVADDAIIGEITSTVSLSQWPEEDGQANFDILGAAYATTSDGLVVFIDNEWTLFEKREISKQFLTYKWTPILKHGWMKKTASYLFTKFQTAGITAQKNTTSGR